MKLTNLVYKPKLGGLSHGKLMLHVGIGGGPECSPSDVIGKLKETAAWIHPSSRSLITTVDDMAEEGEVSTLFRLLREYNIEVGLELPGDYMPLYKDFAPYIIAKVEGEFMNYKVSEIHMEYKGKETKEPVIEQHNLRADFNLLLYKKTNMQELYSWMKNARLPWKLVAEPKWSIELDLL